MSGSLNKVSLIGRLGADPETRSFQNGGRVTSFSLATSESWKDKNGERAERTEWHRISIFADGLGEIAMKFLRKGSLIHLEGKLETREWERDGQTHRTTEVTLRPYNGSFIMLGEPAGARRRDEGEDRPAPQRQNADLGPAPDDDIPF